MSDLVRVVIAGEREALGNVAKVLREWAEDVTEMLYQYDERVVADATETADALEVVLAGKFDHAGRGRLGVSVD